MSVTRESLDPESAIDELVIVWDHRIVSKDDYAAVVTALGDLVRASGGAGLERRRNGRPVDPAARVSK